MALTKIAKSGSLAPGTSVAVSHTSHLQQLLGHTSCHDACTTWGRDEAYQHTATLPCDLLGEREREREREGGGEGRGVKIERARIRTSYTENPKLAVKFSL